MSPFVGLRLLVGGTLTCGPLVSGPARLCGVGVGVDTLLGPEATHECVWCFWWRTWRLFRGAPVLVLFRGGCVLFENCTVDASIFVVSVSERTVDALAPGADEGRGRLR